MRVIVITPETPNANESALIAAMLQKGVDRVHIRHPKITKEKIAEIIRRVPAEYHCRLTLHDNFELAQEFPGVGVNLNARNPYAPAGVNGTVSKSCHSVAEAKEAADKLDYVMLSPIFPSISKPGYSHAFSAEGLASLPSGKVIALGGVTAERFEEVKRYPFVGVALLGAVWTENSEPDTVLANLTKIVNKI